MLQGSVLYRQAGRDSFPFSATSIVELFLWLQSQDIAIRARYIPGCLNVIANHLSQPNQPITTKWSLHPEITTKIFEMWGFPTVDVFVTVHNTSSPIKFMSAIPVPQALAVDALSQFWQGWSMNMFPLFPLAEQIHSETSSHQG